MHEQSVAETLYGMVFSQDKHPVALPVQLAQGYTQALHSGVPSSKYPPAHKQSGVKSRLESEQVVHLTAVSTH